jgi:penicillin-binding protein 1A
VTHGPTPPDQKPDSAAGPPSDGPRRFGLRRRTRPSVPPRRSPAPWAATALAVALLAVALGALGAALWFQKAYLAELPAIPDQETLYVVNRAPAINFYDRTGQLIAARGPRYGDQVKLAGLPAYVPKAMLAAEDRRFYRHGAVDLWAIGRATVANHKAGKVVEGGSTLTQQLAKTLFLTPDQTFRRKIQEAFLAERMEQVMSKDEVLELYLNRIYFGANTFGLDGAARTYFGKPAGQLTLPEAALLAALPKAPTRLALHHGMDAALARSRLVLDRMEAEGWITAAQKAEALAVRPKLAATAQPGDGDFGWALDYATAEALRMAGPNSPDLMVRLTIDPRLQRRGAAILRGAVKNGRRAGMSEGALVSLAPDGAIRAMVGGTNYRISVFNRAAQARRQPGSSFKPFVYAAALENGVNPTDIRQDAPIRIGDWAPQNYGGGYHGAVMVQTALARSINTVAVRLAQETGGPAIASLAHRFGLTTLPDNPSLSVALGAYEVSVLEMTSAFQVFQQGGERVQPYIIEEVRTVGGARVLLHLRSAPVPAYDPARAAMMLRMMQGVIREGTGKRADFGWPAAGKTGTSQNWRDAWFVGFTPEFATGVWVGNDDGRSMRRVTGGDAPAQIWRSFMIEAHRGIAVRDFDWLLPLPQAEPTLPREQDGGFYEGLSAEFSRTVAAEPEYAPLYEPRVEVYAGDADTQGDPPAYYEDEPASF